MSCKLRHELERRIATQAIEDLIAAGYTIDVNDGEETTLKASSDRDAVLTAMFTTDEDWLYVNKDRNRIGWIRFVYGNDGFDVISDYTVNLEDVLTNTHALADQYA